MRTLLSISCLVLLSCLAALPLVAAADSVVVLASRDNTLYEDADGDTSNGAGPYFFSGRTNEGRIRRALLRFDLEGALPPGALVDSAVVTLNLSRASAEVPAIATLHPVTSDWGEGSSTAFGGQGAPAQNGDATWIHTFYPSARWMNPGGDFEFAPSAATVVGSSGLHEWRGEGLEADVQGWLAQPAANFGWLLKCDESGPGTARRFDSRENDIPGHRPRLTLHYSLPTPARSASWGGVKARYR